MTTKDFERIQALKKEIECYNDIIKMIKDNEGDFVYRFYSKATWESLYKPIPDKNLCKKIADLVRDRLSEAEEEFRKIIIVQ